MMGALAKTKYGKRILCIVLAFVAAVAVFCFVRGMSAQPESETAGSVSASTGVLADSDKAYEEDLEKYEEALLTPWPEGFVPDEVKNGVPFKGMKEIYISNTLLGRADTVTPYVEGKQNTYAWFADDKESPDNIVAIIVAKDGAIDSVSINYENVSDDLRAFAEENRNKRPYFTGETFFNMPDAEPNSRGWPYTGSGSSSGTSADPYGYDSPDDYADANEDRYRNNGSAGGWDDAYDDWLDEVGDDYGDGDW